MRLLTVIVVAVIVNVRTILTTPVIITHFHLRRVMIFDPANFFLQLLNIPCTVGAVDDRSRMNLISHKLAIVVIVYLRASIVFFPSFIFIIDP